MHIPGTPWANLCPSLQVFGFSRKQQRAQGWADPRCSFTRPSSLNQNCWRPPSPVSGHRSRTCLWKFVPLPKHLSWKCWIPEPAPRITLDRGSPTCKHSLGLPAAQVFINKLKTSTATPPKHKHGDRKQLGDALGQPINKPGRSALASSVCSQTPSVLHTLPVLLPCAHHHFGTSILLRPPSQVQKTPDLSCTGYNRKIGERSCWVFFSFGFFFLMLVLFPT